MKLLALSGALLLGACAAPSGTTLHLAPFDGSVPTTAVAPPLLQEAAPVAEPAPSEAAPAEQDGRFTVYLGARSLSDDDYWRPVEDQFVFAIEYAHEPPDSVVGFEVGLAGSADEARVSSVDVDGRTGELYAGLVKSFGSEGSQVRPYVGGGLSFIEAEVEAMGLDFDDTSLAGYAHGGLAVDVTPTFYLGVDLRVLFGSDITILGFDGDADYEQLTAFLGWGF